MAASSTDAYNNNASIGNAIPLFNNYPVVSVTTDHSNFWPGDAPPSNSTSPSSDHNWDVDEEEVIKRKIYEMKRQFHNGRYLIVKHLPRDSTEEDVRSLLNGYLVHSIQLQPSSGTARVLLAEPEVLENWAKSSQHNIRGQKVTISPSNTEGLLCLARLPHDYTEEDFCSLVSSFGETNYYFLMRSEKSGESKGYGFVEYVNKEVAMHAKAALDGREIQDTSLVCEWLDPSHVTFASLHSKCLYVDCLPKDYRDMGEFRRIFSKVTNPPYCQIAMKQGALQDWGLVEFNSADDSEETRNILNNHKLKGHPIRVSYYVPGVRAINIYMKLINDSCPKNRGALLPEPPTNKVFIQLRNLTKHNPAFAKSLQNIILTQIHALQQRGLTPPLSSGGRLLGPPPKVPMPLHLHQQFPPPQIQQHSPPLPQHSPPIQPSPHLSQRSPTPTSVEQPLNSNAQAALVILLAAQLQQQQEQQQQQQQHQQQQQQLAQQQNGVSGSATNSILSNPQVLNLLQTLVSQGDPQQQKQQAQQNSQQHPPRICFPPPVSSSNGITNTNNVLSNSLKTNFRNGYFKNGTTKLLKGPLLPTPATSTAANNYSNEDTSLELEGGVAPILSDLLVGVKEAPKDDLNFSIATLLSNAQNLQQLLGSLNPEGSPLLSPVGSLTGVHPPCSASLVTHPPTASLASHPPPTLIYQTPPPSTDPVMSLLLRAADAGRPEHYFSPVDTSQHAPPPQFLLAPPRLPPPVVTSWSGVHNPSSQPLFQTHAMFPPPLYSPIYITPARALSSPQPSLMAAPPHLQFGMGGFNTPVGQKRKSSHFLPSPEASPENGYIGQHSQGIGGHYADSYLTRKKKKH